MKNISKIVNIKVFFFTFLVWFALNVSGIQNIFFATLRELEFIDNIVLKVIIIKIFHLFFLYYIFYKLYLLYNQRHIPKIKSEIIISIIYFIIAFLILLLTWPGTWSADDITILYNASFYDLTPWQHFFSGLFHILCLQTIPIPAGVGIVQIIITSLVVGHCVSNISEMYAETEKQLIILQIALVLITLFPPLILYILSGFRMGIYSYLELLLIIKILVLYKQQKKVSISDIFKISFLTIIISCWRTEGLYYPIFILILYLILGKKVINPKVGIIVFGIVMAINCAIGKINNIMIQENNKYSVQRDNNYSITATMEPVCAIIQISDESDKKDIEAVNKIIDVKYILENPNKSGEEYFWTRGVIKEYTKEEYNDYLKAYFRLALKYPRITINSMWNMFVNSGSGFGENSKQTTKNMVSGTGGETLQLYTQDSKTNERWQKINCQYKGPINNFIRNNVICFLNGNDSNGNLTLVHNIFWNIFIPIILILICLIYKTVKKEWFMVFLILAVVARIPLVFATAPAPYFMYYLSVYICSYVLSFIIIFEFIRNIIEKKSKNIKNENSKELIVYKKTSKEKIKKIIKQFFSFLLISGTGWVIDFSVYCLLTQFANLKVIFANIISAIPSITYVFLMSNKKIFKNTNSKLSLKIKYLIYFGYQLIVLLSVSFFGELLYEKLIDVITVTFLLNNLKILIKILITPITMTINFIFMKNLIEKI